MYKEEKVLGKESMPGQQKHALQQAVTGCGEVWLEWRVGCCLYYRLTDDGLVKAEGLLGVEGLTKPEELLKVTAGGGNSEGLLRILVRLVRAEGLLREVEELAGTGVLAEVLDVSISAEGLLTVVVVSVGAEELLRKVEELDGKTPSSGDITRALRGVGRIKGRLDIAEEVKVVG
ncbi:hypothetical protein E2C01_025615 [Portunus trituberculatus]|uniref:Uncharacterized protein n=1 Tax=Portunus trituberculatus TaxID=210409 RepID=A0A5B7EGE2_PORTR|nr:hypothetical protein [Portunus trituberculatus]